MFQNRQEAGRLLAQKLKAYQKSGEAIVLAIPRGGVVVGKSLAEELNLPLSLVIVKKLKAPFNPELAIGAVAPGVKVIDQELVSSLGVSRQYLSQEIEIEEKEVRKQERQFQVAGGKNELNRFKTFILTDDGIATGATVLAAIKYVKNFQTVFRKEIKLILAVPVIAKEALTKLKSQVTEVVAIIEPEIFNAVGQFYQKFPQITNEEVKSLLKLNKT